MNSKRPDSVVDERTCPLGSMKAPREGRLECGELTMHVRMVAAVLSGAVVAACAGRSANQERVAPDRAADRVAILAAVDRQGEEAQRAWEIRDARLMFSDMADSTVVRTAEGREVSKADMIANLQRRMDMTTRIDTMEGKVDSVLFVGPDEAVAWSSQRFVREMTLPGENPRVRISTVQHEQRFRRVGEVWHAAGPIQEHNQTARWADEPEK